MSGSAAGDAIDTPSSVRVRGTVLLGSSTVDECSGAIFCGGRNLASGKSCGVTLTDIPSAGQFPLAGWQ